jgi:hypothetical protein
MTILLNHENYNKLVSHDRDYVHNYELGYMVLDLGRKRCFLKKKAKAFLKSTDILGTIL